MNRLSMISALLAIMFVPLVVMGTDLVFDSVPFSFQALRTMGYAVNGGADIGECLSTCARITDGDTESWYTEWLAIAERIEAKADSFLTDGYPVSARECYFRASAYYRTAEFFLHTGHDDARALPVWERSRDTFLSAAELSDRPILPVEIPFEGTTLPAYLCLVDESGERRPLIIAHSGFDGTKEELYLSIGVPAVERGYNCLVFEGPGQGAVIRLQHIPFRPNWESVVTPVVDWAVGLPSTDPDRIALVGYSMGGYFAPRAVAFEHRIAACVANGGLYSAYESLRASSPPDLDAILDDEEGCMVYDSIIYSSMDEDLFIAWFFGSGMWSFDADSPSGFVRKMRDLTLRGCVSDIGCEVLILDSENDQQVQGQAAVLFDSLQCPKEYVLFSEMDGADEHCQMGAILVSNEVIFNWLDRVFERTGS